MKKSLDQLLLEEGVITPEALKEARRLQEKSSLRLEKILLKKGVADEESLLKILGKLYDYPYESSLDFKEDPSFKQIPLHLIKRSRVIPYKRSGKTIHVALNDPSDLHPLDDLRHYLKDYRIKFNLATESEISRIIHTHFDQAEAAAREVIDGISADNYTDLENLTDDSLDLANEAPIIRMVNAILSQGIQERASDIHIEPYEKRLDVRYRIDGMLHRRIEPPRALHAGLVSRIKIMANLNIAENRLPQDGRIKLRISGKDVDIRVSTIPTRYGERVVMRLLNKSDQKYSIQVLGLSAKMQSQIEKLILEPNGIFLVTGPTGSGKSTTLYGFLTELNQESRNILTAEDPVEYEMDGVSQMQVQEKVGLTFASALRAMLRQDPDVIMVGEIRDEETARIAIQASLTGHLVLSTLHTNDSPSAVTRLVDMGVEPYLITSTVRGVLAQRLVRVICPKCKTAYKPTTRELTGWGLKPSDLPDGKLYKGEGCSHCVGTGYRGRTGIYELLVMNEEIQRGIIQGKDADELRKIGIKNDMVDLLQDGKRKVLEGITTMEEVLRVS